VLTRTTVLHKTGLIAREKMAYSANSILYECFLSWRPPVCAWWVRLCLDWLVPAWLSFLG